MDLQTFLTRVQSALGKGTKYRSPGVVPPLAAASWPTSGAATDCSGFVAWGLRISRKTDHPFYVQQNGGWFDTAAIYADGESAVGFFEKLVRPVPGSMLVYPDYMGSDGKHHDGHIGIVLETSGNDGIAAVTKKSTARLELQTAWATPFKQHPPPSGSIMVIQFASGIPA